MRNRLMLTLAVTALAMNGVACSLDVEQIMAVDATPEKSGMFIITDLPIRSGAFQTLEGGAVMNIDIRISLLDLIFGDFEGDIEVGEVLIAAPGFKMLGIIPTGILCVVPNEQDPGGGLFEANIYTKEATFDVALNTEAIFGSPQVSNILGGALPFPFALVSTIPFGLSEMLGMLTGSTDIEISQPIEQAIDITTAPLPPFGSIHIVGRILGAITLASADAFPTTPLIDDCIELLAQ